METFERWLYSGQESDLTYNLVDLGHRETITSWILETVEQCDHEFSPGERPSASKGCCAQGRMGPMVCTGRDGSHGVLREK